MKTTYLVKKNPEQPTGNDNWIIMNGKEFKAFRESEEGKRRSNNFIKLCTEYDEECIVMECDLEKLKKWKAELNHAAYVQKVNQAAGFTVISYHQLPMTQDVYECFQTILNNRKAPKKEPKVGKYSGFLYLDKNEMPMVALHWQKYFEHICEKYNSIVKNIIYLPR